MKLKRKKRNLFGKNGVYLITSFFAIILIGIGYAYLNSQLSIVGSSSIAANTWNVYFDNLEVKEGSKEDATAEIVENSTTVNFDINLEEQGEFLEFTVDVVNDGTIDAMLDRIVNVGITDESKAYLDYSISYIDGKELQEKDFLAAGTSEKIVVKAKYKDDIDEELLPEDDDIEDVSLTLSYIQSDNTAIDVNHTICKRATTLHNDGTHTYGNENITHGVLNSGDAFDCDVNKDGIYDSDTERFYYVTDLEENPSYAVLICSNNTNGDQIDNTTSSKYHTTNDGEYHGPTQAILRLPTRTQWPNIKLYNPVRNIKDYGGIVRVANFNYGGYAARLITTSEVESACGTGSVGTPGYLLNCTYLLEKTKYSNNSYKTGYWLENTGSANYAFSSSGTSANISGVSAATINYGVRPAIEVPKVNIEYDQNLPVCRRATTLHNDGNNTFGSLGSGKSNVIAGDAFDCDVNGDGVYNADTERFYYIKEDSNNRAVMVYYNNVSEGQPNNTTPFAYDGNNAPRVNGPKTALEQLPTRTQWPRVTLSNNNRTIRDSAGTTTGTFDYQDHVARLLTIDEIKTVCGNRAITTRGYLDDCAYLMENTKYTNSSYVQGYWLENPHTSSTLAWRVDASQEYLYTNYADGSDATINSNGVRPVIEVPTNKVDYGEEPEEAPVCRRATTLHSDGTHTFGSLGSGTKDLVSGDAFDCDVNKDGTYDSTTERFYYISDLDNDTASLVYYNNVSAGTPSNSKSVAYDSSNAPRSNGPQTAITELPLSNQWRNITLTTPARTIKNELNNNYIDFNYGNRVGRLLTTGEVNTACDITVGNKTSGELDNCTYLMENTKYSNNSYKTGYWLEDASSSETSKAWTINGNDGYISDDSANGTTDYGVRPVIDVPKSKINFGEDNNTKICKRATTLHNDGTRTYGTIASGDNDLISGDAFDCDVNRDGTYDAATERFYYLSDLGNDTSSLVYYNNVAAGVPNSTTAVAYDSDATPRENGPATAVSELPNMSQWKNIRLNRSVRAIRNEPGITYTSFNYGNKAARLLTIQEANEACEIEPGTHETGELDTCPYLMENTYYSNSSNTNGYWLENPYKTENSKVHYINGNSKDITVEDADYTNSIGVRPVIEIANSKIDFGEEKEDKSICKRATILHNDGTHTFGNETTTDGVLNSGDAFDCDVNRDGVYDAETERFYYASPLDTNDSYAVLIYSNSVTNNDSNLQINNAAGVAYNSSGKSQEEGPLTLKSHMPTTGQWRNVTLSNPIRKISGSVENFSYKGHAARPIKQLEVGYACGGGNVTASGYLNACTYFKENTKYSNSSYLSSIWLEDAHGTNQAFNMSGTTGQIMNYYAAYAGNSARPAIEVPLNKISYGMPLPDEYKQIIHLESTGTQYINTGVKLDENSRVELDMQITASENGPFSIFGSRTSATENNIEVIFSVPNNIFAVDFQNYSVNRLNYPPKISWNTPYSRKKIVISNEYLDIGLSRQTVTNYTSFETPDNAYIFDISGNPESGWTKAKMKLYSCKIWKNGVLTRNYIPCLDNNNRPCMYDTVSKQTFYNAGTGEFNAGPVIE